MIGILALTVFLSSCYAGTVMEFTAIPPVTAKGLTTAVNMHCGVTDVEKRASSDNHPEDIAQVHSIFITNADGKSIATVGEKDAASVLLSDGGLTATGNVNGMAHLDLTFSSPSEMTPGVYQCTMSGFSTNNDPVRLVKTWRLMTREPTIPDVIQSFNTKMEEQKQNITTLQEKNDDLTNKLANCSKNIAFHAYTGENVLYREGQTIAYRNTHLNIGQAYDANTGIFKCIVPGTYIFNVHGFTEPDYALRLDIKLNTDTVASLAAGMAHDDDYDAASMTATVRLALGDEVKILAQSTPVSWSQLENWNNDINNHFTGHLIHADGC